MKHLGFAQRFKSAVEAAGVEDTQAALAKLLGVSGVMIWSYKTGEKLPRMSTAVRIAEKLGCNVNWLLSGTEDSVREPKGTYTADFLLQGGPRSNNIMWKIPLVSTVQAGAWDTVSDPYSPGFADEWYEIKAKSVGPRAFALRVKGDSMQNPHGSPSIPEGAIVIVDPDVIPNTGSIVVAKLVDVQEATLKKLVIDAGNSYLKPLNPAYSTIAINGNCEIVGVVKKVEFEL